VNEQLDTLAERFWDRAMQESPSWATILGDHRFDSEVEDLTAKHEQQTIVDLTTFRDAAEAIDPTSLSKNDRITRHVLISEADGYIGALQSRQAGEQPYLVGALAQDHPELQHRILPYHGHPNAVPSAGLADDTDQIINGLHDDAVGSNDHVTHLYATGGGRRTGEQLDHNGAVGALLDCNAEESRRGGNLMGWGRRIRDQFVT
jgi:hypothetical protein